MGEMRYLLALKAMPLRFNDWGGIAFVLEDADT